MSLSRRADDVRLVGAEKMKRLSNWTNRKPVIALMGEFSSGKSTLLNLLLGQTILPMQVTATRLPPIWFQYGANTPFWMDKAGNRHPIELDDLSSVPLTQARFIRVYVEAEQLQKCDLIDTPGISDPNIPTDSWINTIGYADSVLWCTHAGQAWRESERSQWESLPQRLNNDSLLLITRADKIVTRMDLDKLNRRIQRETDDLFSRHHFISLTMALKSREEGGDTGLWIKSGAEVFMNSLEDVLAAVNTKRKTQLARYTLTKGGVEPQPIASSPSEAGVSNVSVLRPSRVRPTGDTERTARPADRKAASGPFGMMPEEKPEPTFEPEAFTETVEIAQPESGFEADSPLDVVQARDLPSDALVSEEPEPGFDALTRESIAASDDGVLASASYVSPEEIDEFVAEPDLEPAQTKVEIHPGLAEYTDEIPDQTPIEVEETDSLYAELDDEEPEEPASDIWREILATQPVETLPQVLDAITLLLKELDREAG